MIRAVTFDLWDTLVFDDSDEPKRRALGLRTKRAERRHLLWQALSRHEAISLDDVSLAYDVCDAAFERVWGHHNVTWTLDQRLDVLLNGLGRSLPPDDRAELVDQLGCMEVDIPPDPIPGAADGLQALVDSGYRLGIVSDAIVTPGHRLRELLANCGLAHFFAAFAFSDEVGRAKPHRQIFDAAATGLRVELHEMVHVGDREHNDVKGPQAVGMKAVLFTAAHAMDREASGADAICSRFAELPTTIEGLTRPTLSSSVLTGGETRS